MNEIDRDLLVRAAKAVGLTVMAFSADRAKVWDGSSNPVFDWSPITDDGDALRLAVKLRLEITPFEVGGVHVIKWVSGLESVHVSELGNDDSATRRAIVRAAASMAE